jgi:phage gpG-like protein
MLDITIDAESKNRIKAVLDQLEPDKRDGALYKGIMAGGATALAQLKMNVTGVILKVRTGNLQRSMGMHMVLENGNWMAVVGSGAQVENPIMSDGSDLKASPDIRMEYADILETGGTIVPVNRQWLTIPQDAALTDSGAPRFSARQVWQDPHGFGYEDTVILGRMIYGIRGKRERLVPLFSLVKSVQIPAKEYMAASIEESSEAVAQDMVGQIEMALK